MMKLVAILKSKSGQGYPLAIAIVLALLLIFTGITEYFRLQIVAEGVRDALQDAVIATAVENYADVYHGTREGYSGGYQPSAQEFEESIHHGDIYGRLENVLGLSYNNGAYQLRTSDNQLQCKVYGLDVEIRNAPLASGDIHSRRFEIDSFIILEVPVSFAGESLPNMKIKVKTSAGYTPKF